MLLAQRPPAFHLKNPDRVTGEGEEAGGIEEWPRARDGGEGGRGRRY